MGQPPLLPFLPRHPLVLSRTNLWKANLRSTNLTDAKLQRAILRGARLTNAVLRGADLSRADLMRADLSEGAYRQRTRVTRTSWAQTLPGHASTWMASAWRASIPQQPCPRPSHGDGAPNHRLFTFGPREAGCPTSGLVSEEPL
ncbi:pentapeptide repeat-containing protein [Streptomyces camponoticapitis]|uniref:pentapeptide repeat-containing protein n=1 Tax=Streptomyces camponoticapitis TaxID=1616125 RepID=UPI00357117A3